MTQKSVEQNFICQEDIQFGESSQVQTRNNINVLATSVRVIYPVNSLAERDALDVTKFPKCRLYLNGTVTEYMYVMGAWRKQALEEYVDIIPIVGTYNQGDKVYFNDPLTAGFIGAVCVAAGSPGTWKRFGALEA